MIHGLFTTEDYNTAAEDEKVSFGSIEIHTATRVDHPHPLYMLLALIYYGSVKMVQEGTSCKCSGSLYAK